MFLTTDANKHPLSTLYGKGNHLWTGIDVQIRRAWFIVDYQLIHQDDDGDELTFTNTVLLSTAEDVLGLASKNITILSVSLMTPLLDPERGGWTIDRLTGIWECTDPGDPRIKAKIYAKEDGSHHVDSLLGATADQLGGWNLLLELPASPADAGNELNEPH